MLCLLNYKNFRVYYGEPPTDPPTAAVGRRPLSKQRLLEENKSLYYMWSMIRRWLNEGTSKYSINRTLIDGPDDLGLRYSTLD